MIACCGLDCASCPIHLATLEQDRSKQQTMRYEIVRLCTQQYGLDISLEDVTDCDGCCTSMGRLFSGCTKCEIRKCAIDRKLTSCAFCLDYVCGILLKHFESDPSSRTHLEKMRENI